MYKNSNQKNQLACAKIAHEIKNPLSIMASTLQLIELQYPEVKNNKHWHKLYSELDFISTLLNDFNKLSNHDDYEFKDIDLGELLSEAIDRFEPFAIQNNVLITFELQDELYNINGDEVKLLEAFTNLLKNAVEAIFDGGSINVKISLLDGNAIVSIKDSGCGIEPENISTIFNPFVSFKENGTGLGLPIVISIIERHKGIIEIQSSKGEGTEFIIKLPLS